MKESLWDFLKICIIFIVCTCLFYIGVKAMYEEYEEHHRFNEPEGPAVKVFHEEDGLLRRVQLFLKLGE